MFSFSALLPEETLASPDAEVKLDMFSSTTGCCWINKLFIIGWEGLIWETLPVWWAPKSLTKDPRHGYWSYGKDGLWFYFSSQAVTTTLRSVLSPGQKTTEENRLFQTITSVSDTKSNSTKAKNKRSKNSRYDDDKRPLGSLSPAIPLAVCHKTHLLPIIFITISFLSFASNPKTTNKTEQKSYNILIHITAPNLSLVYLTLPCSNNSFAW